MELLRPRVQEMVDDILDDLAKREKPIDVIADLAFPLPFAVITDMLDMPLSDADQMRDWSHTLTIDPLRAADNAEAIYEASDQMRKHGRRRGRVKRGQPDDDDLLNALLRADDDGDVLTDAEISDNVVLLYIAGHETTVNLIGNGVNALLKNRSQLERLQSGEIADTQAVEELLRFDSPVQLTRRIMLEPIEIEGEVLEKGDFVFASLGAANHDPAKFGATGDELDLGRDGAREHVSFGSGIHHCLGVALARIEGQVAIGSLVRRFPNLDFAGDPTWNGRLILRGLDALPVSLG